MNCIDCDAHREDLQTGDHYCRDLGVMVSPGAVECLRQQAESSYGKSRKSRHRYTI